MAPLTLSAPRRRGHHSTAPLSPGTARILCHYIKRQMDQQDTVEQAAQAAGIARSYLSQMQLGTRTPRNRKVYLRLFTQAFGLTPEEAQQLVAQAQLQEAGFTHPELSQRLAEVGTRSRQLPPDQLEPLIDHLEEWLHQPAAA